ncbi:hypothetical protein P43SY_003208 [Pythium insidiosum]|uniref:Reverse transcriptase/retrotransposon-derived protein RNase H-like domain-containing protein n=1 Tax=Pythium insidiosum TaxID=114742 RepID=A0AAD5Q825_PYTIN|nr:hypothetical protein P43SY_003208 [Pythium insidiosum]
MNRKYVWRDGLLPLSTHIISDQFASYVSSNERHTLANNKVLKHLEYKHTWVNHSKNYVDPKTGANTNSIEACWEAKLKSKIKAMGGTWTMEQDASVLDECLWRSWFFGPEQSQAQSTGREFKIPAMPTFWRKPSKNCDGYVFAAKVYMRGCNIDYTRVENKPRAVAMVCSGFRGGAASFLTHRLMIDNLPIRNLDEFERVLSDEFVPSDQQQRLREALSACRQSGANEDYVARFREIIMHIRQMSQLDQVDHFVAGLKPETQKEVNYLNCETLRDAIVAAQSYERPHFEKKLRMLVVSGATHCIVRRGVLRVPDGASQTELRARDIEGMVSTTRARIATSSPFFRRQATPEALDLKAKVAAPLLRLPDMSLPFQVTTDASKYFVGGVLSQIVDGYDHPIGFYYRKLSDVESRWPAHEQELYAIKQFYLVSE